MAGLMSDRQTTTLFAIIVQANRLCQGMRAFATRAFSYNPGMHFAYSPKVQGESRAVRGGLWQTLVGWRLGI
jgi:hypothetical protein